MINENQPVCAANQITNLRPFPHESERGLKPLCRAVSKQCGFDGQIHWFRVNGTESDWCKKVCCFKNIPIRVDTTLLISWLNEQRSCCKKIWICLEKNYLYINCYKSSFFRSTMFCFVFVVSCYCLFLPWKMCQKTKHPIKGPGSEMRGKCWGILNLYFFPFKFSLSSYKKKLKFTIAYLIIHFFNNFFILLWSANALYGISTI